ncbi:MAG TPA: SdiA-regulated domain-containing protein, partial [Sphingobacteriaceae bacterium]
MAHIQNMDVIPRELKEISGISFVNDSVVAAVQDETGVLYFYDIYKKAIVRQYPFAKSGDYEDVAVAGNTVYIVNSSGTIFRIDNFRGNPSPVIRYDTPLTEKNNIEGLAWDEKNNRLLLAAKDAGLASPTDKEIYAFDLATGKLHTT